MAFSRFLKRNAERGLLAPLKDVTLIDPDKYHDLGSYISVGDRVAWQRPYVMIHEAIVLHVDGKLGEIWVMERTLDICKMSGRSKVSKMKVYTEVGDLYRYNDKCDESVVYQQLKNILLKVSKKGYNPLAMNCQNYASTSQDGSGSSYQTCWLAIVTLIKGFGIPAVSEAIERLGGGHEMIGCVTATVLHAMALVAELYIVCCKSDRTNMTNTEFLSLITRQVLLGLFQWLGNILSSFPLFLIGPPGRAVVIFMLIVFGAIVFDAFLLWRGWNPEGNWRYLAMAVGGAVGLAIGVASVGCFFEFLLSMVLGFVGAFIANGIHHAGSWLISWLKSKKVDGEWLNDMGQLQKGDHITTYGNSVHPYCHAIFYKLSSKKTNITVFRNTYEKGVVEEEVPFQKKWVYRYKYPPDEVRKSDEVIKVAKAKLQEPYQYSFTYNCKTFAELCKRKHVDNVEGRFDAKTFLKDVSKDKSLTSKEKKQLKKEVKALNKLMKGDEHGRRRRFITRFLHFRTPRSGGSTDKVDNVEGKDKNLTSKEKKQLKKKSKRMTNNERRE